MEWKEEQPAGIFLPEKFNPKVNMKTVNRNRWKRTAALIAAVLITTAVLAQDGNAGISQATSQIKGYFATGTSLMYAIGAIVGLIGAIKVYNKWSAGEPDTAKVASSWFGACIFLVIVATVLKSFFGV